MTMTWQRGLALAVVLTVAGSASAQGPRDFFRKPSDNRGGSEIDRLRGDIKQLEGQIDRLSRQLAEQKNRGGAPGFGMKKDGAPGKGFGPQAKGPDFRGGFGGGFGMKKDGFPGKGFGPQGKGPGGFGGFGMKKDGFPGKGFGPQAKGHGFGMFGQKKGGMPNRGFGSQAKGPAGPAWGRGHFGGRAPAFSRGPSMGHHGHCKGHGHHGRPAAFGHHGHAPKTAFGAGKGFERKGPPAAARGPAQGGYNPMARGGAAPNVEARLSRIEQTIDEIRRELRRR